MTTWYLNRALSGFREAVNARWPRRDKSSDGTIGDAAHAARSSDHNPDPDGSVDAWDMDVDGVDVELLKQVFEDHESAAYWIHNDQIAFRVEGWRRKSYAYAGPGRNRHTKHVHWNTRSSYEASTKPWIIPTPVVSKPAPGRPGSGVLHTLTKEPCMQTAFITVDGSSQIFSMFDNGVIRETTLPEWTFREQLGGGLGPDGQHCKLLDLPVIAAANGELARLQSYSNALRDLDVDTDD
jgi:hypothetical protein